MWAFAVLIGVGIIIFILYKGSKSEKEMEEVFNQISEDCKLSGIRQNEPLTANTTTTTSFNPDNVVHDYKIFVTLNDFSCPMLTLKFGQSEIQMRQVLSILNLIIKNS